MFGRFWRQEQCTIKFQPADESQPRLGGSVQVSVMGFDHTTFMPFRKTYHGIYAEDFVTYGEYKSGVPENDEELLMIMDESTEEVTDMHTFKFTEGGSVTYERKVNGDHHDAEIEHSIEESELSADVGQSWTETLFYGAGNSGM